MNNANLLRTVNLNLLPVLQALLRERSLVGASRVLALSQPAVHAALTQLRTLLDDPLLVREGRRMVMTPRALQLVDPVERACAALRDVLTTPRFEAAQSQRCFKVAASDYAPLLMAGPLLRRLVQEAPGVSLHVVNVGHEAFEQLRQGDIDLVLVPRLALDSLKWPATQCCTLWQERFIRVVRSSHPLCRQATVGPADLAGYAQMAFDPSWYPDIEPPHQAFWDDDLADPTSPRPAPGQGLLLRVEQFCALPLLALQSDAVVLMPQRLFELLCPQLPLTRLGRPCPTFDMAIAWGASNHDDPGHRWFRALLGDALAPAGAGDQARGA